MSDVLKLSKPLILNVDVEEERPGRWIADVTDLPGVMVYGTTAFEAIGKAKTLALDVVSDRLARGEDPLTGLESGAPLAATFGGVEFTHAPAV